MTFSLIIESRHLYQRLIITIRANTRAHRTNYVDCTCTRFYESENSSDKPDISYAAMVDQSEPNAAYRDVLRHRIMKFSRLPVMVLDISETIALLATGVIHFVLMDF